MKPFLIQYRYKGAYYAAEIGADNEQDARRRLSAIRQTGSVQGELMATIPVPGGDFLPRVWSWIKGVRS